MGVVAGTALAGARLPGITLGTGTADAVPAVLMASVVPAVLTRLIFIGPSGRVPLPALAAFGLAGFVQDALIWWLLSWLGPRFSTLHIEGFATIRLAALCTRGRSS